MSCPRNEGSWQLSNKITFSTRRLPLTSSGKWGFQAGPSRPIKQTRLEATKIVTVLFFDRHHKSATLKTVQKRRLQHGAEQHELTSQAPLKTGREGENLSGHRVQGNTEMGINKVQILVSIYFSELFTFLLQMMGGVISCHCRPRRHPSDLNITGGNNKDSRIDGSITGAYRS